MDNQIINISLWSNLKKIKAMQIITDLDNNRILTFDIIVYRIEISTKYISIWRIKDVKEIFFIER